ncbi:enoyl-CoA hydratase-related protein [Rhodopseudomonas palustris]|uniref:enoyl-CoA hydratase/isomerase family protein n=1 Tax=Rhodopseudomonas palustris TaxID=1076 RepID=UPI0020CF8577|nr:enoyl-CoA hydratase-related protein [Rhodopseudomonas palustris]MCP9629042.1 enoyl-CoA hydratase-related protein [Rhodopseudomonas palustris]
MPTEQTPTGASSLLVASGPVTAELHPDGVAHVRLNRPEAANGLNVELLTALHQTIMLLHGEDRVRVVLLTGAGSNFCAGGDVHTFLAKGTELPAYIRVATAYLGMVASSLIRLKAPVVTAVQGYAAGGGGMGLVCASDFVVAGESAKFIAGATRVAMVPDAGVTVTLTQLVGLRRATEILMLNPIIDAPQARDIGLITRVVPDAELLDQAWTLARTLAAGAPAALANTKRLLWNGLGEGVEAAMPEENHAQEILSGMADAREGLSAVIEKRSPKFTGR